MAPVNFGWRAALLKEASGALLVSSCWSSCLPIYDINTPETHRLHFTEKVEFENWAQGITNIETCFYLGQHLGGGCDGVGSAWPCLTQVASSQWPSSMLRENTTLKSIILPRGALIIITLILHLCQRLWTRIWKLFETSFSAVMGTALETWHDNSKLGSTQQWMALTCCQDHILTVNIWFVWSKTSYSGDKRRCYNAGRTTTNKQTTEDRATQPMKAGGWVSQFEKLCFYDQQFVVHVKEESSKK